MDTIEKINSIFASIRNGLSKALNFIVKIKDTNDSVTVRNCFSSEYYRINSIKFADKTISYDNIVDYFKTTGTVISGTSEDDRISSNILSWAKATIGGREGDDTINGSAGNEVIYGRRI